MNLIGAVRELRRHTGESQQSFATRLGLSIRAIANYEKDRAPTGKALFAMAHLAETSGRRDLAQVFAQALGAEMGLQRNLAVMHSQRADTDGPLWGYLFICLEGVEQIRFARAFYDTMIRLIHSQKPEFCAEAAEILRDLEKREKRASWRQKQ